LFRGLLLRLLRRTRLTQRDLAARAGVTHRSVQDWESGANYPTAERLQRLIRALLELDALTVDHEAAEASKLWAAAVREAPRMHTPFDDQWFAALLAVHVGLTASPPSHTLHTAALFADPESVRLTRAEDWGRAPDTRGFVGRQDELTLLHHRLLTERCRLIAIVGMGGIGKSILAARLAEEISPYFERVCWRTLRDAPPVGEWLAVIDNGETLLEPGVSEGQYRLGVAGYGRLMRILG
jgi:transcriptional regulator with XRE-family HTH domain